MKKKNPYRNNYRCSGCDKMQHNNKGKLVNLKEETVSLLVCQKCWINLGFPSKQKTSIKKIAWLTIKEKCSN